MAGVLPLTPAHHRTDPTPAGTTEGLAGRPGERASLIADTDHGPITEMIKTMLFWELSALGYVVNLLLRQACIGMSCSITLPSSKQQACNRTSCCNRTATKPPQLLPSRSHHPSKPAAAAHVLQASTRDLESSPGQSSSGSARASESAVPGASSRGRARTVPSSRSHFSLATWDDVDGQTHRC